MTLDSNQNRGLEADSKPNSEPREHRNDGDREGRTTHGLVGLILL